MFYLLIRLSTSESSVLSIIFNGKIFYYETDFDGSYLFNRKRFSNVSKMVKNGFEIIEKREMNIEKENETEKVKPLKTVTQIFGVDLIVVCLAQNNEIPKFVEKCIEEIEKRGLKTEGIYRMPGSEEEIETLKNKFDGGNEVDLTVIKDIHYICSLLKLYLRFLPNPLIPCKTLEIIFEQIQMN